MPKLGHNHARVVSSMLAALASAATLPSSAVADQYGPADVEETARQVAAWRARLTRSCGITSNPHTKAEPRFRA